jgi:hypothetical protein
VLERGHRGTIYIGVELVKRHRGSSTDSHRFLSLTDDFLLGFNERGKPCLFRSEPSLGRVRA